MSNLTLSDILFDDKGENLAGKDTLAKSSVKRCHAPNTDPREIVTAFLIAMAFIALYVGAQAWTKAGIEERFTPTQEARQAVQGER